MPRYGRYGQRSKWATQRRLQMREKIHFCHLVDEAIKDETEGIKFYRKMWTVARHSIGKNRAPGVITALRDEQKHKEYMLRYKKAYCGKR